MSLRFQGTDPPRQPSPCCRTNPIARGIGLAACLWISLSAGCNAQPAPSPASAQPAFQPPSEAVRAKLGETFDLAYGSKVYVEDADDMMLSLTSVEDSRCPRGVECFTAGLVTIRLEVSYGAGFPELLEFDLPAAMTGPVGKDTHGYRIQLFDVAPYPEAPDMPKLEDYKASLKVSKSM